MKTAIILAQGQGLKAWPLSVTRPKASLPIGGTALLRLQLDHLEAAGISTAIVVASSRGAARLRHVASGRGSQPVGAWGMMQRQARDHEMPVQFVVLDPCLGNAPALLAALQGLDDDDPLLVIYGDVLFDSVTLGGLLAAHAEDRAQCLVLAARLDALDDPSMHLAMRVQEGRVQEMIAHPRHSVTHRLAGMFVCTKASLQPYLEAHPGYTAAVPSGGMPPQGEADLAQSLQMMVEDGIALRAVEAAGLALDVDRPWDVLVGSHLWLEMCGNALQEDVVHPTARVSERAEIHGHIVVGQNAVIGPGAILEGNAWLESDSVVTHGAILGANVHIGPRCLVKDYAWIGDHTSLGPRCKISHCAEVHGVLFGRSTIMHHCEVWGVLGEAVDIGAGTAFGTLRFDDQPQRHRVAGRWETPQQASAATFIGDFCRTGVNCIFQPGCKVGPYCVVGPGVVVSGDVPEHSLLLLKQEVERTQWGSERYGW